MAIIKSEPRSQGSCCHRTSQRRVVATQRKTGSPVRTRISGPLGEQADGKTDKEEPAPHHGAALKTNHKTGQYQR